MKQRWLALFLCSLLGCADDVPEASELVVSVATDFASSELSYLVVETLDVRGERAVDSRWLSVGDACPLRPDGLRGLGTFSVQRGEQALARLRLVALRLGADGRAIEVGRERIDAVFARGRLPLDLTLSKLCSAIACPAENTCDPGLGACRAVQRFVEPAMVSEAEPPREGCIAAFSDPPPEVVTRTTTPTRCVSGDGRCDAPCESRDADCLHARGEACLASADCIDGALCVHGVCCDRACNGPCERCDLPDQAGICSPLRYADPRPPRSSPDFAGMCSKDHVEYSCADGHCGARCSKGFADCNDAIQTDGCETRLTTASDCRACGDVCTYGFCGEDGCTFHHTTGLETSASRQMNPGKIYSSIYVPSSEDRMVRALGVLLHPQLAGGTVRLALYAGNASGYPDTLLAETEPISRTQSSPSGVIAPDGAILIEGRVAAPVEIDLGKTYFLAAQVSQTAMFFGGVDTAMPWYVVLAPYDAFPARFPLAEVTEYEFVALTMYAVTTPH